MNQRADLQACRLTLSGRVQGVGFRPFVYRLAHRLGINGWVYNASGEVEIAAEARPLSLLQFKEDLIRRAPPLARPVIKDCRPAAVLPFTQFIIRESEGGGTADIHLPPDQFACDECLAEMNDPGEERHRYPFINCTQCGPRYTIIRQLPYDRPHTTMAGFTLCPNCEAEYGDPMDRRFHAQPLACPACGPELRYLADKEPIHGNADSLAACIEDLENGAIVAVRGIGGYHLICDAANETVVSRLRRRKHRPSKPFAVMVPWAGSDGLDWIRRIASPSEKQIRALIDPARPIVLVPERANSKLAPSVAPGLDEVGIMLPYSPLHHLLLAGFKAPLLATSGNISGEPVITEPSEAQARLAGIADSFLHHNRPIQRPADDPVFRQIHGRVRPFRIGRGNAPLEIKLPFRLGEPLLAVGAFLKNTITLAWGDRAVISPHIGDLGSRRSNEVFRQTVKDLQCLYGVTAKRLVSDAHPDYPNTRWARDSGLPVTTIWHHRAHASALAGESGCEKPMIVFTWDGLGLGEDRTAWGGEAFIGTPGAWHRAASFRPYRLPGGDRVVFEPWRTALSLVWEAGLSWPSAPPAPSLLREAWQAGLNSPLTSSVGRLFDAATVFTGLLTATSYDGEAPIRLESSCDGDDIDPVGMPIVRDDTGLYRVDWSPLIRHLISGLEPPGRLAATFHESLAWSLRHQAEVLRDEHGVRDVGLTGGVFQNRRLANRAAALLGDAGFTVHLPEQLPVNDAAISFGQIIETGAQSR